MSRLLDEALADPEVEALVQRLARARSLAQTSATD
jgi:hypothetical protein